ncbi:hypothetical protein BDY19DRAFT_894690 [Irpex rosettiformis]|uniref:Uncharacterized protein n=1 Tax=Irpex rosettiformis TaxID=378272 RepID=A0ACB8TWT1_9APHY|nr:hypothetical protein BDY19DRAFT_894690 [Irpex rosettiformis]
MLSEHTSESIHPFGLPMELVETALEEVFYDHQRQPDYATLSACSKVCSAWRAPAQKLLFHQLTLPGRKDKNALECFRAAVYGSSEQSRLLASHIRRVHVVLDHDASEVTDLVDMVSHCHHLYEVTLHIQSLHALDTIDLEALREAHRRSHPTCIRALGLLYCGVMSPILYQLLAVWPTVQYLRLGTELAAPPPKIPPKVRLYELVLWRLPPPAIMAWILSNSGKGCLRVLDINEAPSSRYDHVLEQHYQYLHSLRFFRHTTLRVGPLTRRFANLREFVVTQPSSFLPLGNLPESIEHLGFRYFSGVTTTIPLGPIIAAVDKLPKLRLVTCDANTKENEQFASLEKLCREREVVISFDVVPVRTYEDPVPLNKYPRGRSVENFRHMNQPICLPGVAQNA